MKLFDVKVCVCGGRDFNDYAKLTYVLDNYFSGWVFIEELGTFGKRGVDWDFRSIEIITGGARGADQLAERYALEHGYKSVVFKADWEKHRKAAGFIRNTEMLKYFAPYYDNKIAQGFIPKH